MKKDILRRIARSYPSQHAEITQDINFFKHCNGEEIDNFKVIQCILRDPRDNFSQQIIKEMFAPEHIETVKRLLEDFNKASFSEELFYENFHRYCKADYQGSVPGYSTAIGERLPGYNTAMGAVTQPQPSAPPGYQTLLPTGHLSPNGPAIPSHRAVQAAAPSHANGSQQQLGGMLRALLFGVRRSSQEASQPPRPAPLANSTANQFNCVIGVDEMMAAYYRRAQNREETTNPQPNQNPGEHTRNTSNGPRR